MDMRRPEREEKYIPPVKFRIPGILPAYSVIATIDDALKYHGLEIQVIREPQGMPYLNNSPHLSGMDMYTCILKKREEEVDEETEPVPTPDRELTYDEKVEWFFKNNYETGMELEIMRDSMRDDNLDNFHWHGEKIQFPKMLSELNKKI